MCLKQFYFKTKVFSPSIYPLSTRVSEGFEIGYIHYKWFVNVCSGVGGDGGGLPLVVK